MRERELEGDTERERERGALGVFGFVLQPNHEIERHDPHPAQKVEGTSRRCARRERVQFVFFEKLRTFEQRL